MTLFQTLRRRALPSFAACLFAAASLAHGDHEGASAGATHAASTSHVSHGDPTTLQAVPCEQPDLRCAQAASPFFDSQGRLWLAWVAARNLMVARSSDGGRSFSEPLRIGDAGQMIDTGADARPQWLMDAKGRLLITYGVIKDKHYNAQSFIASSLDDGATFSPPRPLSTAPGSQRFPALAAMPDGRLFAVWIAKPEAAASNEEMHDHGHHGHAGGKDADEEAALTYAWSDDGGASFQGEQRVQGQVCECCRSMMATRADGTIVIAYRRIFEEHQRDPAVLVFKPGHGQPQVRRVSQDKWVLDGCPHHGPALALTSDGAIHIAWFTQGQARQGLFYARSTDGGRHFTRPLMIDSSARQASRPQLWSQGRTLWLVWKTFDGQRIRILARQSNDAGTGWSDDRVVGETSGRADHPVLVGHGSEAFVSWLTQNEGYRLIPLSAADAGAPQGAAASSTASMPAMGGDASNQGPRIFTKDSFARILAQHAKQPLIVHIWAPTCAPCMSEMPRWREFTHDHPQAALVFIQGDDTPTEQARQALSDRGLNEVESWFPAQGMDEFLRVSIDPSWQGEIPYTLLIAPDGQITRLQGVAHFDQIEQWLKRLGARDTAMRNKVPVRQAGQIEKS